MTVARKYGMCNRGKEAWSDNFRGNMSVGARRACGPVPYGSAWVLGGCRCAVVARLGCSHATIRGNAGCLVTKPLRPISMDPNQCICPRIIRTAPGMSHARVPEPELRPLGIVRAGDWKSWKRSEPALPCDCDLRFSFPSSSPESSALGYARMVVDRPVMEDRSIHRVWRRESTLSRRRLLTRSTRRKEVRTPRSGRLGLNKTHIGNRPRRGLRDSPGRCVQAIVLL